MKSEFVTVYVAAIITDGDYAYVIKNGKPFLYLEGAKVDPRDGISPKNCLIEKLAKMVGFQFSSDWVRYIGTTTHEEECVPTEECNLTREFVVIHYWLDAQFIKEFAYAVEGMMRVSLSDMAGNKDNRYLCADSLAAKRVLELRGKHFKELQKLA